LIVTTIDRHIGRSILISTTIVLIVLLTLFIFFIFIDGLSDLGKGKFGFLALTQYVILSLPRKLYEIFPMVSLLGTIIGLSSLALNSELIAMRAAGISILRIVGSVLKIGLVFIIIGMLFGEFVVPVSESQAQRGRNEALGTGYQHKGSGIWLRDGETFINIGEVLPDETLLDLNLYRFDQASRLLEYTYARSARFDTGKWVMQDVRQTLYVKDRVQTRTMERFDWPSSVTPEVVGVFAVRPEGMSLLHLYRYIRHLEKNRQETNRHRLAFWNKLMLPLATVAMILIATPFVFGQIRSGGLGQRVFIGIMLGLGFIILNRGIGLLGLTLGMPPILGVLIPILGFLALALMLLRRVG